MTIQSEANRISRAACRKLIAEFYPHESRFFDQIWDAIERQLVALRERPPEAWHVKQVADTMAGGLGLNLSPDSAGLFRDLLALVAVVEGLSSVSEAQSRERVVSLVSDIGAGKGVAQRVQDRMVDFVVEAAEGGSSTGWDALDAVGLPPRARLNIERVYIERMVNGRARKNGWYRRRVVGENRKNPLYDILVDELNRQVMVRPKRVTTPIACVWWIRELSPRQAGMLWLALRNFGGFVTFAEIRSLFRTPRSSDSRVHQVRYDLADVLGPGLRDRLLAPADSERYPVSADAVNYCWIRLQKEPRKSELRYRTGHP